MVSNASPTLGLRTTGASSASTAARTSSLVAPQPFSMSVLSSRVISMSVSYRMSVGSVKPLAEVFQDVLVDAGDDVGVVHFDTVRRTPVPNDGAVADVAHPQVEEGWNLDSVTAHSMSLAYAVSLVKSC